MDITHAIVSRAILLVYDQNVVLSGGSSPKDWLDLWTARVRRRYVFPPVWAAALLRNVLAGILTRFTDPNGDRASRKRAGNIAEYYKHGVPNEAWTCMVRSPAT